MAYQEPIAHRGLFITALICSWSMIVLGMLMILLLLTALRAEAPDFQAYSTSGSFLITSDSNIFVRFLAVITLVIAAVSTSFFCIGLQLGRKDRASRYTRMAFGFLLVLVFMSTMWLIFSIDSLAISSVAVAPFDSVISRPGSRPVRAEDKSCFDVSTPPNDTVTGFGLSSNDAALPFQVAHLHYTGSTSSNSLTYIVVPSDVPDETTIHGWTYGFASTMDLEEAVCKATEDWPQTGSEVICRPVSGRPALFTPTAIIPSLGKIVYRSTNTTGRLRASSLHTLDSPSERMSYRKDVSMASSGYDHYYNLVAVDISVYRIQYVKSGSTYYAHSMEEADAAESKALIRPMLTDVENNCVGFGAYNLTRDYNKCVLDGDEDFPGPCRDLSGLEAVSVKLAEYFSRHSAAAAGHILIDGVSGGGLRSFNTVANGPACMFVTAVMLYGLVAFCGLLWNARTSKHTTADLAPACDTDLGAEKATYS